MKKVLNASKRLTAVVIIVLGACAAQPTTSTTDFCAPPTPDKDWAVSTAAEAGFDPAALCKVLQAAGEGKDNIHGIVIERHGRLVAEIYKSGPDSRMTQLYGLVHPFRGQTNFSADELHDIRSVTKSVTSLLYGIALGKDRAPSVEASVLDVYPEISPPWAGEGKVVTFRHLLTMSSGLEWKEWGHGFLSSDETRLFWKSDFERFLLERPLSSVPGSTFNYSSGATAVLAETLSRKSGKSLVDLARTDLFEPLGISHVEWATDYHGRGMSFAGLRLQPRDMLKIGRLVNTQGVWQGRQIVPKTWMIESTQAHIATGIPLLSIGGEEVSYGYQWWTGRTPVNGRLVTWVAGMGNGGQRIFAVPELDLTVTLTAGDYGSIGIVEIQNRLLHHVLAAVKVAS